MEGRSGKIFVLILSGLEDFQKALEGLKFALHAEQTELMDDIEIFFYGPGVELLGGQGPEFMQAHKLMAQCREEGIVLKACSGNLAEFNLQQKAQELGVEPAGAPVYIPTRIRDGYQVITF